MFIDSFSEVIARKPQYGQRFASRCTHALMSSKRKRRWIPLAERHLMSCALFVVTRVHIAATDASVTSTSFLL